MRQLLPPLVAVHRLRLVTLLEPYHQIYLRQQEQIGESVYARYSYLINLLLNPRTVETSAAQNPVDFHELADMASADWGEQELKLLREYNDEWMRKENDGLVEKISYQDLAVKTSQYLADRGHHRSFEECKDKYYAILRSIEKRKKGKKK